MLGRINALYRSRRRAEADNELIAESVLGTEETIDSEAEVGTDEELEEITDVDSVPEEVYKKIDAMLDKLVSDPDYDDTEISELIDDDDDEGGEFTDEELSIIADEALTETGWNHSDEISARAVHILFPRGIPMSEGVEEDEDDEDKDKNNKPNNKSNDQKTNNNKPNVKPNGSKNNNKNINEENKDDEDNDKEEKEMNEDFAFSEAGDECPACFPGAKVKNSEVEDFPGVKDNSTVADFEMDTGDEDGYYGNYTSHTREIERSIDNGEGWSINKSNGNVKLEDAGSDFWEDDEDIGATLDGDGANDSSSKHRQPEYDPEECCNETADFQFDM